MKTRLVNKDIRHDYTIELLKERGLTEDEIQYFLTVPDASALQSPSNFDNIREAASMFEHMVNLNDDNRILIVVDSDVDGFTSAAIFYQYAKKVNPNLNIDYVLHEGKGHGLADTINTILDTESDKKLCYVVLYNELCISFNVLFPICIRSVVVKKGKCTTIKHKVAKKRQ